MDNVAEIEELVESLDRRQCSMLWIQLRERYSKNDAGEMICAFCFGVKPLHFSRTLDHQPFCIVVLLSKRLARLDGRMYKE